LPGAVAKAVAYLQHHPVCDLVYGRANYIDARDRIVGTYHTVPYDFTALIEGNCICQPAAFWRTRVAEKVGPFNEALHFALDYEYWIRIDRYGGTLAYLPEALAASRLHPDNKTATRIDEYYREIFQVCQTWDGFVPYCWFLDYWHAVCYRARKRGTGPLRWVPFLLPLVARLHHQRYNHLTVKQVALALGRKAARPWVNRFRVLANLVRRTRELR